MEDEVSTKSITMPALNFMQLVDVIRKVHDDLSAQASRAVNASLTLRNWLIGFYVEEYERQGVDRTEYGDKLMDRLAESLTMYGVSRCERRELYRYRQLYLVYPQIVESLSPQFRIDGAMQELRKDCVKVNYQKFGSVLKKIPSLDTKEE